MFASKKASALVHSDFVKFDDQVNAFGYVVRVSENNETESVFVTVATQYGNISTVFDSNETVWIEVA